MYNPPLQRSLSKIGQTLLQCRHNRNDKQMTVAKATGISIPVLSKIECGKYKHVTIELLFKLAEYYSISLAELIEPSTND